MKRYIFVLILTMMMFPFGLLADSFTALWKQVEDAREKDLPKTELQVLEKIVEKATAERQFGHLLKARILTVSLQTSISPDSLKPEVDRLCRYEESVRAKDPVLAAVCQSVLGRIYSENPSLAEDYAALSKKYFEMSLANPALLAVQSANGYTPLLITDIDSKIFGNDLLHVLAFEAHEYKVMHDYYKANGNRPAACLSAYYQTQKERFEDVLEVRKSRYLHTIDSLINEYQDLREAGELAIEHYNFMDQAEDASAEEKMNYINYALSKWGAWPRMNILRNAQNQLTLPSFSAELGENLCVPYKKRTIHIRQIVNLQSLTMTVTRVNVDGTNNLRPSVEKDYLKLKQKLVKDETFQTVTHRYVGQPDYKVLQDSMDIEPLPAGVYLIEITTDKSSIKPQRSLLYVSDVYVVSQKLPDNKVRMVAVSATNGQPIPGATIRLTFNYWDGTGNKFETLTCDKKGEVVLTCNQKDPDYIYAYTEKDKACKEMSFDSYFRYYKDERIDEIVNLFIDRSIYRPGQTVKVSLMAYENKDHELLSVLGNRTINISMYNANYEKVETKTVTTDEYGSAAAEFQLPTVGLTGRFTIRTDSPYALESFMVEEYKRPTFRVDFDEVKEEYQAGDTVTVKGWAKSFAGVPVQGAKVACHVVRRPALWWWYRNSSEANTDILKDTLTTADDGSFSLRVPMTLPKSERKTAMYYNFVIEADVTDLAGESHYGETYLPLSNRKTAFSIAMPGKILADSSATVRFSYVNNAGNPIDSKITYYIDNEKNILEVDANTSFKLPVKSLKSGTHELFAKCGNDTLKQKFVVFSMKDNRPAVVTHDWFYCSANTFPIDGSPVYVQMGSSDKDQHIIYNIISGNKLLESGVIDQSNALTTRRFSYKEEYGDGIMLSCAWVHDGVLYKHVTNIVRQLPDKELKLTWSTFRDKLTPGQKEEWTLNIRKPDGTPAKAQLLSVLYDKSLDEIKSHSWYGTPQRYLSQPSTQWYGWRTSTMSLYGEQPYKMLAERALSFTRFDSNVFDIYSPYRRRVLTSERYTRAVASAPLTVNAMMDVADVAGALDEKEMVAEKAVAPVLSDLTAQAGEPAGSGTQKEQVRENLSETAFFYPALLSDENGDVKIAFTLPESITTWKFMGFAHDKEVNYGSLVSEAVASKTVMVQPNMPRFLRKGDKAVISSRIINTSEKIVGGTAKIMLINPNNDRVLFTQDRTFSVDANKTTQVSFDIDLSKSGSEIASEPLLICKIMASGQGYSDGEQHYLPILTDEELVTNTYPFTQNEPGTLKIDLTKLFPQDKIIASPADKLTVEYTNNPSWLMIQALPTVATTDDKNAISQVAAFYANSIAANLMQATPSIKRVVELWKQENGSETSLSSALERNQELKNIILSESPWVMDADKEAEQKQQLINLFDENAVHYRINENFNNLSKLQNGDGSWSWWQGMKGSHYITTAVVLQLVRLNLLIGEQSLTRSMINNAVKYLAKKTHEEVIELKKLEKKNHSNLCPSELAMNYLYIRAVMDEKASVSEQEDITYLVNLAEKQSTIFTIYGKARSAIVLAKNNRMKKANEYLQSIREYTVYKEEVGRYFDTRKAYYSWFNYKIPTQVAAIEALQMLAPDDVKTVAEMQRWLLQEKRTQSWDTPINCVNAVYAFMKNNLSRLTDVKEQPSVLMVDSKELDTSEATAGLGYVKTVLPGTYHRTFTVEKKTEGTSWGAVYAQFMQKSLDVADFEAGIKVTREILAEDPNNLKVGDNIRVRITIEADRDYDFVQVCDKRAACLEPLKQLSGYHWGCYIAPRDNATYYYYDKMPKGKHILETEYYVDREGVYQSGTCTVQCAYAPEYSARTAAKILTVKK